jgi:hypothetical protein
MAGERIEIAIEQPDIDRPVGQGLGAVEEHRDPLGMGGGDDLANRIDGAERIRDVHHGAEPRARAEELQVPVHQELTAIAPWG